MTRYREGVAGTLRFYPPDDTVQSSATVALYYPGGAVLQAAASATVDSVNTTVAAAAARGARQVSLASATGVAAGVRYLLAEAGRTAVVEVKSLSVTTAYLVGPLPFAVTTAATFKGYALTYSLTTTHTADVDQNYRAEWTGSSGRWDQLWHVVGAVDYYSTTWAEVVARHGWISAEVRNVDLDGDTYLATAWQMLRERLRARGKYLERVRDVEQLKGLHCALVNVLVAEERAMRDPGLLAVLETAQRREQTAQDELFSSLTWYDVDEDLAASSGEESVIVPEFRIVR